MTSIRLGEEHTETHLLTHAEWNSMPELFTRGSNETGVRRIQGGEIMPDSFELIQHGWHDWRKAGEVIRRQFAKGKSASEIADLMDYLKDRRGINLLPRATTL
jgi:hypothetical protein